MAADATTAQAKAEGVAAEAASGADAAFAENNATVDDDAAGAKATADAAVQDVRAEAAPPIDTEEVRAVASAIRAALEARLQGTEQTRLSARAVDAKKIVRLEMREACLTSVPLRGA